MTTQRDILTGAVCISGRLDIEAAVSLRDVLLDSIANHPSLSLDLGGVESCDAAAVQVFISARKSAAARGKSFSVAVTSEPVSQATAALGLSLI